MQLPAELIDTQRTFRGRRIFLEDANEPDMKRFNRWADKMHEEFLSYVAVPEGKRQCAS